MGRRNYSTAVNQPTDAVGHAPSPWQVRYGGKFRPQRVDQFPAGILPPRKVRIYRRDSHYLLQWWDKVEKRTLSERVDGDLVEAVYRARQISEQLEHFRTSSTKPARSRPRELAAKYLADLNQRASAAEIDVATAARYGSAIRWFLKFAEQPPIAAQYPHVAQVDRDYQLAFSAYLNSISWRRAGQSVDQAGPLRSQDYVTDVVRGMFGWAADAERGNLLPAGFRNPFVGRSRRSNQVVRDPVRTPDITVAMATDLVKAADRFQLSILTPLLLFGLRPGELGWLFKDRLEGDWLRVECIPDLDYVTKGRRDKRFPVPDCLQRQWSSSATASKYGLLYVHRRTHDQKVKPPLVGNSLAELTAEFRQRCATAAAPSASDKRRLRSAVMKDAGQLQYDHVEGDFRNLARRLGWPAQATLKDLRHLFATCLEDAGVPEFYRRYFMGHSPGRAPIVDYTHLTEDKIRQHYTKALESELSPIVNSIDARLKSLDLDRHTKA